MDIFDEIKGRMKAIYYMVEEEIDLILNDNQDYIRYQHEANEAKPRDLADILYMSARTQKV